MNTLIKNHLLFATSSLLLISLIGYATYLEKMHDERDGTNATSTVSTETTTSAATTPVQTSSEPSAATTVTPTPSSGAVPTIVRPREFEDDD